MKKTIKFDLQSPVKCTEDEFREWILYHLVGGSIEVKNPLANFELCGNVDNLTADGEDVD